MLIGLLALCVGLDVTREIFFKIGAIRLVKLDNANHKSQWSSQSLNWLLAQKWTAVGVIIWAIEVLFWAQVLTHLPLNVAVLVTSLTYALTPLAGRAIFGETIVLRRWIGIAAVTAGAALVGTTGMQ